MILPILMGYCMSALTLFGMVWSGYFLGLDVLDSSFLYKSIFISWFSGFAFYGWSGYMLKIYIRCEHLKNIKKLRDSVIEPPEIPNAELKRIVSNTNVRQKKDDKSDRT